jgi:DNA-binding Lrp family transcriptional regulator
LTRLLAFLNIFVESPETDNVVAELSRIDGVEELYEGSGESDVVTLVSAADIEEFRDVLKNRILKIKGVRRVVSSVVLHAHKGRRCTGEGQSHEIQPAG